MNQRRRCDGCKFWAEETLTKGTGDCRRRPPVLVATGSGDINTAWPNTDGDEWCGEFVELHDEADDAETTSSPNRSSTCCCRMTTMPRRARRTGSDDA